MGPTIPGAEEELVASMIRAIKWELSLWILGNQRDIATNAIQGLLLDDQLVGLPRARSESEWVLSLHLVAMMRPPLADISPFDLTACDIEPRGAVAQRLRVTGLYILPDPRPGAAAAVQSAISSGRRIVLVYCFCEPVAFELYIIVPDPLPAYRPESDWQTNLQRTVNPRPAVSTEKCFCLLDDSCPDELGDLSESADVMDLMRRWADFYDGPMMAAAYKALDIFKRPHACDEFVYAIHIHRHENQLSRKAVAFSFQVVVAEKVRNTELAQWIRRQRFAISRNDLDDRRLHDMVANEKGYKRDPSHISVQTFVYATSYGKSENLNDWQCCPLPFHVWIRRSTRPAYPDIGASPLAYLQDMVKRGVFCPCQQYTRNGIQCAGVSSSPECTGRARVCIVRSSVRCSFCLTFIHSI